MTGVLQDFRYALRQLRKSPGFTAVAVTMLALGIGANTAIFSLIDGVILRSLPYADASHLVMVWTSQDGSRDVSSYPEFEDWKAQSRSYEDLAAFAQRDFNWIGNGGAERLVGLRVSPQMFSLLKVPPFLGRVFASDENLPGKNHVAVLSNELWTNRFASDPHVVGRTLSLDGEPYTVVGVAPSGFSFPPGERPAMYVPLEPDPNRGHGFLRVVGRLNAGATMRGTQAEMSTISDRLAQSFPKYAKGRGVLVQTLRGSLVQDVQGALWILCGAVGFVLLISCANVANLLLARVSTRRREFALRAALGAAKRRLAQQLLIESLLLGMAGGALGLLVVYWSLAGIVVLLGHHVQIPRLAEVSINGTVLFYTFLISVGTSVLFGLVPALGVTKTDVNESLKEGSRGLTAGHGRERVRSLLVVTEVALAMILLAGAGLMIQTFVRLTHVNLGFNAEKVFAMEFSLPRAEDLTPARRFAMLRQVVDHVGALPGVRAVGTVADLPLNGDSDGMGITLPGRTDVSVPFNVQFNVASPGYLEALGIPILQGRNFTAGDVDSAPRVAVINQQMARRYWPNDDAIGKQFALSGDAKPFTIVGITGNVRDLRLSEEAKPMAFVSCYQDPFQWRWVTLAVRASNEPAQMFRAVRATVGADYPALPMVHQSTLADVLAANVAQPRAIMYLLASFAGLALVLAGVGLYGVISYSVSQRTNELGVRIALGAQLSDIRHLVLGQGLSLTLIGLAIGIAGALLLTRFLTGMLYGVTAADPVTYIIVSLTLAGIALLATFLPARRAAKIDPMVALRYE